jgi:hypothetical protein
MTRFGGIASNVIPANAGIQTWQLLRPLPLDSRFRGNDTGKSVIGSALKQHALARSLPMIDGILCEDGKTG